MSAHIPGRLAVEHTAGSIRYDYEPGYCGELIAQDGMTVAAFVNEPSEADARRLVACWNACEGVPTEVLEAQQSGGLPWSVADQIEQRVQFNAYKEGSEEAFGAVVEQKRKAEERASCIERTIQVQQCVIVDMRAQRDGLLEALKACLVKGNRWHPCDPVVTQASAAIAKVKGGTT